MKKAQNRRKLYFIAICLMLLCMISAPPCAYAQTAPVDNGLSWLRTNQKPDGSWGVLNNFRDTSTVIDSYRILNQTNSSYLNALTWLNGFSLESNDYLVKRISSVAATGADVSADMQRLLSNQNTDGGWAYYPSFDGNVYDTVLALSVLNPTLPQHIAPAAKGISYLVSRQNIDGSWSMTQDSAGDVSVTALAITALKKLGTTPAAAASVAKAVTWLQTKQNLDGGFGSSPSTVHETVYALNALMMSGSLQSAPTATALNFIYTSQRPDGSWNGSAYETALAIRLLGNVKPNLSMFVSDITVSNSSPKSGEQVTLRATIRNTGLKDAVNVPVQLSMKGSDNQIVPVGAPLTIPLLAVGASFTEEFVFDTAGKQGLFEFIVTADPNNTIVEIAKDDNQASLRISVMPFPDLVITNDNMVLSKATATIGDDVTITATIANQGILAAQNIEIGFYHDAPTSANLITTAFIDNLDPGQTATRSATWKTDKVGTGINLYTVIDPQNKINELTKGNNQATKAIDVAAGTDANLTVSYQDISFWPAIAKQNSSVVISAVVKNQGFAKADGIDVAFYKGIPGNDGVLLSAGTITSLATGASTTVSYTWANIPDAGDKYIYVKVDPANKIQEFNKTDNDAFATLTILTLPDLMLSTNSINLNPAFPKDGDKVSITATIENRGQQDAQNVTVKAYEGGVEIGSQQIPLVASMSQGIATFPYDATGKQGAHLITIVADPDNAIPEQNKDNNSASRTFSVQSGNLWLTEQIISPNGDGIQDSTQFFFRLDAPATISIKIIDSKQTAVRTFSGPEFVNTTGGNLTWDGLDDNGMVVPDGQYQLQIKGMNNIVLGSLLVTVDTNRSPLSDAFGTKYLLNNNLTCMLTDIWDWKWFPDESGILILMPTDPNTSEYPYGLYTMGPDGQDIMRIVPYAWSAGIDPIYDYSYPVYNVSSNSEKVSFILYKRNKINWVTELQQLWVMDQYGQNMVLIDSFDAASQTSILDFKWSPQSDYIVYRTQKAGATEELWFVKPDGTGKTRIDSNGYFESNYMTWSPDNSQLAYVFDSFDTSGNYSQRIRILDISTGNTRDVFTVADPSNPNSQRSTGYLRWLGNQRIVLAEYGYTDIPLWLIDATGNGNHITVAENIRAGDITVAPDRKSFAFVESTSWLDPIVTKVCDLDGKIATINILTAPYGLACMPSQSAIIWSPDSKKIVFSESIIDIPESGEKCSNPFGPQISIVEVSTTTKVSYANAMLPFAWLSDGVSIAGYVKSEDDPSTISSICALNASNGDSKCTPMGSNTWLASDPGQYLSPQEHYFTYYQDVDQSSICYGRGYSDLWSMSSLLNLTADLRTVKEKSAVILKGIAADLNFDRYQLEYADVKNPTSWSPVAPPSDVPVINDVFTSWIPPYEGTFYVRLTVWDKAGNTAIDRKRVSWGQSSSITNLYKTLEAFSPNGDGIKDTVELHYRVLEPVHLEFYINDENNNRIRTFNKDYTSPIDDYITWDGRGESGNVVPDGKYTIKIFDYEFFVEVDNTPPDVNLAMSEITSKWVTISTIGFNSDFSANWLIYFSSLNGHAFDKNLKSWTIEYGESKVPQDWHEYKKGTGLLAKKDDKGNLLLNPVIDAEIEQIADQGLELFVGKKVRLTAEDFAGNKSVVLSNLLEERLILNKWDSKFVQGLIPTDKRTPGLHVVEGLETIRLPLASINVQYFRNKQWFDAPAITDPASGMLLLQWDNSFMGSKDGYVVRLKAIDSSGTVYYSNIITTEEFGIQTVCDLRQVTVPNLPAAKTPLIATNILSVNLNVLKLQFGPTQFGPWTDYLVFDTARGDVIPGGEFYPVLPPTEPGKSYFIRMIGIVLPTSSGGNLELYTALTSYPAFCTSVSVAITYKEKEDCGALADTAEIGASISNFKPNISLNSLSLYLQFADGLKLLRKFDLAKGENLVPVSINTSTIPEGQYQVKAVLNYFDNDDKLVKEVSGSDVLTVDRVFPVAHINYPDEKQMICPVQVSSRQVDWLSIAVEGSSLDNTSVKRYELYYGNGENPVDWSPATTKVYDSKGQIVDAPITGGSTKGSLGIWNVSGLKDTGYSLKLKVVDFAGNVSCYTTKFSIDRTVEITSLTADKTVFSPNGDDIVDDVKVNYQIDEYATVAVRVFKLIQKTDGSYGLDAALVRTITAAKQHLGGADSAVWDGKTDGGTAAPDGRYGIAVSVTDSCGNTAQKWAGVEVDNTPPTVAITYPKSGDPLGNIVEVQGSATDPHFQSYILEVGQNSSPDAWSLVSSGVSPVNNNILGKWNTFGLTGTWTLRLTANDKVGNKNITTSTIDLGTRKTLIKNLSVLPGIFSPNGDNKLDTTTVTYGLTDACNVMIEFLDANSMVRRTYSTTVPSLGIYTYTWDGKDNTGVVAPDGAVTVRLTAILTSNTSVTQTETVTAVVDATLPTVDIKQPLNNSYTPATDIVVSGTINDTNLSGYTINNGTTLFDQANQTRENYAFGTLSALPEGAYTLAIKATDQAQNETDKAIAFTIDRTPPVVKLDTPTNNEYHGTIVSAGSGTAVSNQQSATVNITGSIVEKNLDTFNLRYGLGDAPTQWTDLATGTTVTAYPSPFAWKVGKTDGIPDGQYTLSLYAKDKAGLQAEVKVKVTIDNTPPTVAITSLHDNDYVKQAVDIKGTVFDQNLDKYTLDISEGQCAIAFKWATIKTGIASVQDNVLGTWQALPADGDYCLRLTATDKVGSSSEAKVNVKVDTHPPAAPVLSGKADTKVNAQLDWTQNTEPDLAGYNVYRGGQKINTSLVAGYELRDENLSEGIYTYTVKAVDFAGWESVASNEVKIKIDLTGPDARIRSPQDGGRISGLNDIKGTAYSADDFKQYRIYIGQGAAPTTWALIRTSPVPISYGVLSPWDTLGLAEGQVYSIKLEAEDISGNITVHQISVTIDNTPPAAPVLITASAIVSDVTVTWKANTEPDLAGYLLYRNDQLANVTGIVVGNLQPYLIAGTTYLDKTLPDGTFRYYLMAMDQAGNVSDQSNTIEVTIDTHPPHAAIIDPLDLAKFGAKITVRAESPDLDIASVQFQYQSIQSSPTTTTDWLNLGSPVTSATIVTYLDPTALGLTYGDYRLRAVATDKGNKTDPAPGFITVTYTDLTPPAAPMGLFALVSGGTVTLTWTANTESDLQGYNVYRDGQKINTAIVTSPVFRDENLADAIYSYTVTAVDTNQNESRPSNLANATVYTPVITQPYTPIGQSSLQVQGKNAAVSSNVEISVENGTGSVLRVAASADATGVFTAGITLSLGENKITAKATDSAGNISKTSNLVVMVYNDTPGAPTGLAATAQDSDVHLTWNPNPEPDILGYNVFRDGAKVNKSDALLVSQATFSASSSLDPNLYAPETAMDASLTSSWMPQSGTSTDNPAWWEMDLVAPELISHVELHWGTDVDASGNQIVYAGKDYEIQVWSGYAWITQVKVTGNAVKDNVYDFKPSYRTDRIRIFITDSTDVNSAKQIRLAEVNVSKDNLVAAGAQPTYDDLNLKNNQYGYTVMAVDNYGFESALSSIATATVFTAPPSQPAVLTVSTAPTGLNATWVYTGSPAAGFNLYRSTTSGGPYTKISSFIITGTSSMDTDVLIGVTYYYVVTVVDNAGNEGAYSNEASGTPPTNVVPAKPVIFFPTIAGSPITVYSNTTDISGSAALGSSVALTGNGTLIGLVTAQTDDSIRNIPLDYDGNAVAMSPDGKTLAYIYNNAIWLKSLVTGAVTQAVQALGCYTIVWSPDSKKLAYSYRYDDNGNYRINIYDTATGNSSPLTSDANVYEDEPSWYPDGNKVLFTQDGGASSGIFTKDLVSGSMMLVVGSDAPGYPKLSPDNKTLAYFEYLDASSSLVLYDLSSNVTQTVDTNTDGWSNEWSPDGRTLAFVSYRNGSGDLFLLNSADGTQTLMPGSSGDPYYPTWTADGSHILFDIFDNTTNRDSVWMTDIRTLSQPMRIMPDLQYVYYVGSSRSGTIVFIDQNLQGVYMAHLLDLKGTFSFSGVSLAPGENIFTATATDAIGNRSDPSDPVSVTYNTSMLPDLAISTDDLSLYPPFPIAGEQPAINAVVWNTSSKDIQNVDVDVYVWNALGQLELLKSETIPTIAGGSSAVVTTTWNSAGKLGDNRLIVVVDASDTIAESNESNNMAIKDFYVADKVGVSMSTSLDAAQYSSNQNANISVTMRNTGPALNTVLDVRIEDTNGYPVNVFDPKTVNLAYAVETPQNFVWSTGSTFAGAYAVHSVLKDATGIVLAENTIPFTIASDAAADLTVVTDKIAYGPGESVITSFSIKNSGKNSIIPILQAKASIINSLGTILFTETKTATNLLPGASVDLSSGWNTGLNLPGDYQAVVEVSFDGGATVTKSAAFKINTLLVLTGSIAATPSVVPVGNTTQVTYTLANSGNVDALGYVARITIIDPETQAVMQTQDATLDIAQNSSKSGQIAVSTIGYSLKTYTAVLQTVNQGTAKNHANTPFTIKDLTPPVVTIVTPLPNSIFSAAVALSVLAVDNASGVDRVEYQLDSGLWNLLAVADPSQGRYGTTWNPLPADSGSHTINFRATDMAGNTSPPISVIVTIQNQADTTPPTGSIEINNGAAYTNNPAATLTLDCTDIGSGCAQMEFSSDSATWSGPEAYETVKAWQLAAGDGPKTIYVKYIDGAGNISVAYSASITLDTTPPVLGLSTLADGSYTNNNTLNIAGTATDNIALSGVTINNTEIIVNADGTFSQAVVLVSGPNVITTIASDMAGNTFTDTRTIILDQTAPQVTITYPHDNSILSTADIIVTGMVDKPATVMIKVNNGNPVPAVMDGLNFSLPTTLIYAQNTIEVTATDLAGNIGTAKRTVIVDNISPALAVTYPAQDITTNQSSILLQGTVADLTDLTVSISFDGVVSAATVSTGTFEQQLTFTEEKTYAVIVTATDAAGNTSTVQRNIIYDKTPPALTINPVTAPTNIVNQQVSGTMEPGATVSVTCPTAMVGLVSYPTATTWQAIVANMTEGDNILSATATDQVGNVSAPMTATIVLDTQAPDTLILSGPPALTNINGAGFSFTSTEAGSTFECKLDQGAYAACVSLANFINLLDGTHTLQVRATDLAGNTDPTPAAYTWTVDTMPPVAVVTGMPQSPTRSTGAVLTTGGQDVIAYKYKLDASGYSPEATVQAPTVLTGLSGGTHTVSVIGKDSAGNWQREEFATVVTWLVDLEQPVLTISTLPNGAYTNNKILNVSGTATDNVAVKDVAVNGILVTLNADNTFSQIITLATGTNIITSIASDTAGNTATDVRTIILDDAAPAVTITDPADNSLTNKPNYIVRGSIDKPGPVTIKINNGTVVLAIMDGLNFSLQVTLVYGQNTIEAAATDHVGNVGTAKRTVTMDDVSPALAVIYPAQDITTNLANVLLQGTVADLTDITVTLTHDGNTYTPTVTSGTFQQQLTFSMEKVYNVIVTATDAAGNSSTVQRNIIYDKTPPLLTINPVITPTNNMIQQVSGTMEAGSTVTVTCPTAMIGEVSYPTTTTWQAIIANMAEGNNVVSAAATDPVGNISSPVFATILLDTQAPVTTASPAAGTYTTAVSVTLSTNETATIYYTINGTVPTTSSPIYTGPIIITANTTLNFFAIDLVGNREVVKSALYTINDDITPPITTITVGSPNYTAQDGKFYVTSATVFTVTATDNLSGVAKTECRIDSGAWTLYVPFTVMGEASHTISCRSTDNRGNVEAPKTLAAIVDNTPPVTTITISNTKCGSSPITPGTLITLAATDTMSGVRSTEYNIDNGAWAPYIGAFTLAGYAEGPHTIYYRSTDNVGNVETAKNKAVTLSKKNTTLTYTGPTFIAQGKAVILSGTLKASGGTVLDPFGQTIVFILASGTNSQSCTGITDAQGKASCTINPVTVPIGVITITASFSGDALNAPSTTSKTGIVFDYAAAGTFVIGDKNAVVNKTVTFWGSKWWKNNSLSGGSAPSSFKGYADATSTTPPGCNGTWTSRPGNSSQPPSSIPSYMAVIASSTITKSGSTISGNAVKIAIIKTNSGYAPDPGHAGTGTVVGILCP